jgi:hypothetical protein
VDTLLLLLPLGTLLLLLLPLDTQPPIKLVSGFFALSSDPPSLSHAPSPALGYTVQIGVPDVLIGSVLGRGGSVVKDIMVQSGARIQ